MISVSDHGAVRVLTLDRPKAFNALSTEMPELLIAALGEADADDSIKVVVLTGAGKAFCAGMDLDVFANPDRPEVDRLFNGGVEAMFDAFIDFSKPLICAVNGVGAGFGITVCGLADITIVAEEAKLLAPFVDLGVVPEGCSTHTFTQLFGPQLANWLLLSATPLRGADCKAAGFALDVVPLSQLMEKVMERAQLLASKPIASLVATKALIRGPQKQALRQANQAEMKVFVELFKGPDCRAAIEAMLQPKASA